MGYQPQNLNSEILASIIKTERVRDSFYELRTEVDDFFDELEDDEEFGSGGNLDFDAPYERGGKMKQGYNDRMDESLSMRRGKRASKGQSYKSRRDESKGMSKSMGKRAYSSVRTMDTKKKN